ncbi:hypothetical protein NA57DRAFT_55253 [Rhizodiscina lignyota]|uniref:SWI5-dependent HO expression protein 3 n=1 Tax=Rhizodiscina lignyota TaxID=1504668 RepID=A0A9P4M6U7_9PEZI|nr:hypothetical protein NA57DRAFT_55253 [Rhizodiscina lignyota]
MTTKSTAMKGPTEILNISNFKATLTSNSPSPPPPRYVMQSATPEPVPSAKTTSSTKVIERLTAENDRLRRELRAERAAKEEAEEQLRTQKNLIASLQSQTSNLEHVHGSDKLLAERKDRRIAQLKESLESEVSRRTTAEEKSREMGEKLGETTAAAHKEVSEAQAVAKRADTSYETLKESHHQLRDEIHGLRKRISDVQEANRGVDERIERISIVGDERDKHQAAAQQANAALKKRLDEHQERDERMAKLEAEMEEAIRAMRWVVKLHSPKES